jgi:hypothetical protein
MENGEKSSFLIILKKDVELMRNEIVGLLIDINKTIRLERVL